MMNDYNIGVPRDTYYKYWSGSGFSSRYLITNDGARAYHEINVAALSSENVFISEWSGNTCYFNWKQNGKWTGHKKAPTPGITIGFTSSALSAANNAAIAVAHSTAAIYLIVSQGESPDPNPPGPEPEPDPNLPPSAHFTFSPLGGLYPVSVTFNAGNSKDSDGTITNYHWDFGDGATGSGKVVSHVYNREGRFEISLRVTDDDGATASATGELEVFGIVAPVEPELSAPREPQPVFHRIFVPHHLGPQPAQRGDRRRDPALQDLPPRGRQGRLRPFLYAGGRQPEQLRIPGPHPGIDRARVRVRGQRRGQPGTGKPLGPGRAEGLAARGSRRRG